MIIIRPFNGPRSTRSSQIVLIWSKNEPNIVLATSAHIIPEENLWIGSINMKEKNRL